MLAVRALPSPFLLPTMRLNVPPPARPSQKRQWRVASPPLRVLLTLASL